MTNTLQNLSDDQLDSIVGGAALPSTFDSYLTHENGRTAIKIGTANASGGTLSVGHIMVQNDTDKLTGYLDRLEKRGETDVYLYPGGGDSGVKFSIDQVRSMLG